MFREMRRKKQQFPQEECIEILKSATSGVLALAGDNDYPYALPISYAYHENTIYIHCATEGHKLDAIRRNPKASFCIIAQDDVLPEQHTTHYRSVIAFGVIDILNDSAEKRLALEEIAKKYSPGLDLTEHIVQDGPRCCVLALRIEHLTGKEHRDFMQARNQATTP